MDLVWLSVISGILGAGTAAYFVRYVLKQDKGNERVREICRAIQEGAMAFIHREYRTEIIVVIIITLILGVLGFVSPALGWKPAVAFIFGALCSLGAGYAGLNIAIRANGRTTTAAEKSLNQGLRVAFRSGAVMGLSVVSIGVIGVSILYLFWHNDPYFTSIIPAYATGASLVALFARVGGGIFTKGADAGADLVGKIEAGIPEDDPRNAAVIADQVGDNVGDVCGMGADLFESYVEAIIGAMVLSTIAVGIGIVANNATAWYLPLLIAGGGIIASIIGSFLVRVGEKPEMEALLGALRWGTLSSSILTAIFSFLAIYFLGASLAIFWAVLAGLIAGVLMGESTNYFTSYAFKPTREISKASTVGGGAAIVQGLITGFTSTWPPVLLLAITTIIAFKMAGFYGVAIAATGMLSTLGVTLATDAYGPVADNAGGISTMAELAPEVREKTDALDSLGNTTAATGKGFAIGAAALNALGLTLAYGLAAGLVTISNEGQVISSPELSILSAPLVVGVIVGALLPAIFVAMTMKSVGVTAALIVEEVRRQWREIKGLREGKAQAEYGRCVDICTRAALKEMLAPSLMALVAPIIVGMVLGKYALGGFLIGSLATGFILAITLNNAGGAWDNAKKWIEAGNFGGKGSEAHKIAVIGDTTGDPMKDTAGPSLNIMLKLMAVTALLLAPVLANFSGLF
ncbi:MAG: sodium-translocating pyrophosphatase [Dehalococcoidales bacterium]|nr:sodium-translocating pyrophosphatase [Dehalococcoidales bacterium]